MQYFGIITLADLSILIHMVTYLISSIQQNYDIFKNHHPLWCKATTRRNFKRTNMYLFVVFKYRTLWEGYYCVLFFYQRSHSKWYVFTLILHTLGVSFDLASRLLSHQILHKYTLDTSRFQYSTNLPWTYLTNTYSFIPYIKERYTMTQNNINTFGWIAKTKYEYNS